MADKWIQDAFNNAQPTIDGMSINDFADMVSKRFGDCFPAVMTAFEQTYGKAEAMKYAFKFIGEDSFFELVKCFFTAGYKARIDDKEGQQ